MGSVLVLKLESNTKVTAFLIKYYNGYIRIVFNEQILFNPQLLFLNRKAYIYAVPYWESFIAAKGVTAPGSTPRCFFMLSSLAKRRLGALSWDDKAFKFTGELCQKQQYDHRD